MELADISVHIENTSKRSILGKRWRKCNIKEQLDNLPNVNLEKRVILWKYFNDVQINKGNNPLHTVREESVNSAGDCGSMSYKSYSSNDYESRTNLNQAHLFDDGYSCNLLSSSDSSSALSHNPRPGLTREAGDGTETPDIPSYISDLGNKNMFQSKHESCHTDVDRSKEYSNRELEYSCTLRLFAEPEEPSTTSAHEHGVNPLHGVTRPMITKIICTHTNHECLSSTAVNNKDCLNTDTSQHKQRNVFTLTKARLRHNGKIKLKQLLKLYKARIFNKKRRSTEHVKYIGNGNAPNTDRCNSWGSLKLASTFGSSQNATQDDICRTGVQDDRDIANQVCESTEKNDIVCSRVAEFFDCDCLNFAMDCYCSETDEFAYLNNGFVMK